jgi:RNA-directed DNA polymerase
MTLDGLERLLQERFPLHWDRLEKKPCNPKVHLVRYADDFIITGNSRERLENEVRPLVERFLNERGLQLSPEKTSITHISEGFDFLGQNLRQYDGKLLIKPSKKNVQTFLDKVRGIIKSGHPGLGQLSSAHRGPSDVQASGRGDLASAMAMGEAQTSQQRVAVDR